MNYTFIFNSSSDIKIPKKIKTLLLYNNKRAHTVFLHVPKDEKDVFPTSISVSPFYFLDVF